MSDTLRARADTRVTIRVPVEIRKLLQHTSKARGEDVSSFIRRSILKELALLNYLSLDQKKALGVRARSYYPEDTKKALDVKGEA